MKKMIFSILLIGGILAGCASGQKHELAQYVADTKPLAVAGIIKWSDYYKGVYDKLAAMGVRNGVGQQMQSMSLLIDAAQSYEAGRTTQEQFENVQRMARGIEIENASRATQAQAAYMGQALQNYGNTVYRPVQTTTPINCTTTHMPGLPTSTTTCN